MTSSKATFNWSYPLLLDQQLTADERMVRDAVRAYAQDKPAPRVLQAFRHEQTIPTKYGGGDMHYVAYGLIAREMERVNSGYRWMMSVQSSLVILPINQFGSEVQK